MQVIHPTDVVQTLQERQTFSAICTVSTTGVPAGFMISHGRLCNVSWQNCAVFHVASEWSLLQQVKFSGFRLFV